MDFNNFFPVVSKLWKKNFKFCSKVYPLLKDLLKIKKKSKPETSEAESHYERRPLPFGIFHRDSETENGDLNRIILELLQC